MTKASDLLWGDPFDGAPFPPAGNPSLAAVDGRTACLRVLASYLGELVFRLPGPRDPQTGARCAPIPFRFKAEDVHLEWPDDEEKMGFPAAVLLAGDEPAVYSAIGLTPRLEEDTRDVLGRKTAVWWMSENVENVALEVWCSTKAERRSIKAGLEEALVPVQQMYGIRFRVPDYYGQLVCFALQSSRVYDEIDAVRGRRRVRFTLEMRFNQVALARRLTTLTTYSSVEIGPGVTPDASAASVSPVRRDQRMPENVDVLDPALPRDPC